MLVYAGPFLTLFPWWGARSFWCDMQRPPFFICSKFRINRQQMTVYRSGLIPFQLLKSFSKIFRVVVHQNIMTINEVFACPPEQIATVCVIRGWCPTCEGNSNLIFFYCALRKLLCTHAHDPSEKSTNPALSFTFRPVIKIKQWTILFTQHGKNILESQSSMYSKGRMTDHHPTNMLTNSRALQLSFFEKRGVETNEV